VDTVVGFEYTGGPASVTQSCELRMHQWTTVDKCTYTTARPLRYGLHRAYEQSINQSINPVLIDAVLETHKLNIKETRRRNLV